VNSRERVKEALLCRKPDRIPRATRRRFDTTWTIFRKMFMWAARPSCAPTMNGSIIPKGVRIARSAVSAR